MPDMKKLGQHQFIGCKILLIGLYRIKGFTGNAACYYRFDPVCTDHDIDRNVRPAFLTGIGTDFLHCKTCPAYKLRVRKILSQFLLHYSVKPVKVSQSGKSAQSFERITLVKKQDRRISSP